LAEPAPAGRHLRFGLVLGLFLVLLSATAVVVWSLAASPARPTGLTYPEPTVQAAPQEASAPSALAATSTTSASGVAAVSPRWVAATATKAGIPATAVLAYARAQLEAPCRIGWTTLAGIGWVESQHGTMGGRTLLTTGYSSAPITGPQLSGGLDHAYGPMQFIPDTWSRYASDGDGDGKADINDIFDASLAAARYLCADGYDLSSASGWAQAIFSYNHSQDYVNAVYAAADAYDQRTR
jgi:membrane-bound lytic murein transglycosylase B